MSARPNATDEELERQAQEMVDKMRDSLEAAKLPAVKDKILKRLKAQRDDQVQRQAGGQAGVLVAAPPPGPPMPALALVAPPPPPGQPPQQVPPPPPTEEKPVAIARIDGVELCGDEAWYADEGVRQRLRESVIEAHKEQKILVGAPADEVNRICPQDGRILGAGAVLRLGGAHLGGYGESDIAYAYRQLSRALHPDKNPDIPNAQAAFHRLSEAADELRQGLQEQRAVLQMLECSMGGQPSQEVLERPQEALFAEACRALSAICSAAGEGEVPGPAMGRAISSFARSARFRGCDAQWLLAEWFDRSQLLELFGGQQLRTAYDCAPKRCRAQFLCLLNRAILVEARRCNDCVRGSWGNIMQTFPELGLWRDFRERVQRRVWDSSEEPAFNMKKRARSPKREEKDRKRNDGRSKWDAGHIDKRSKWDEDRRDREREVDPFQKQRDREWDARWTASENADGSDRPDHHREIDREIAKQREREQRMAIAVHPVMGNACRWARKWRSAIAAILPSSLDCAVPLADVEVQKLTAALWNDVAKWASGSHEAQRGMSLFTADTLRAGAEEVQPRGLEPGTPPATWAFIPMSDLLLVLGESLVGITAEGVFSDNPMGHKRLRLEDCYKKSSKPKPDWEKLDDRERQDERRDERKDREDRREDRKDDRREDRWEDRRREDRDVRDVRDDRRDERGGKDDRRERRTRESKFS